MKCIKQTNLSGSTAPLGANLAHWLPTMLLKPTNQMNLVFVWTNWFCGITLLTKQDGEQDLWWCLLLNVSKGGYQKPQILLWQMRNPQSTMKSSYKYWICQTQQCPQRRHEAFMPKQILHRMLDKRHLILLIPPDRPKRHVSRLPTTPTPPENNSPEVDPFASLLNYILQDNPSDNAQQSCSHPIISCHLLRLCFSSTTFSPQCSYGNSTLKGSAKVIP